MRTSNYRKHIEISSKTWKIIGGSLAGALVAGVIFFFAFFRVENVKVMGSEHYTEQEIMEMALTGPLASNSVLAPLLYTKEIADDIPFVDGFSVTQMNRNTIVISVKEKKPVGCIPYLDSYVYFDRTGVFIEGAKTRDEKVPYFDGIQVNKVIKGEKLPIKDAVLNTAVALATIFEKNQMIPDHIEFDQNYEINLLYGDITVQLGKDKYLEDKMARVIAILPMLENEIGILHMENVTDSVKTITFEREIIEYTAENWPGGYDENGVYDGYSEYAENGRYVGAKPKSDLDYALENWVGGYDIEGDYTGWGEYDQYYNYVGPAPTQEDMDANGDWKGGYNEYGQYDGYSEYDREGNYLGPKPENTEEESSYTEEYEEDSYDYQEEFYDYEEESY